jgi:hypothetical protein
VREISKEVGERRQGKSVERRKKKMREKTNPAISSHTHTHTHTHTNKQISTNIQAMKCLHDHTASYSLGCYCNALLIYLHGLDSSVGSKRKKNERKARRMYSLKAQ